MLWQGLITMNVALHRSACTKKWAQLLLLHVCCAWSVCRQLLQVASLFCLLMYLTPQLSNPDFQMQYLDTILHLQWLYMLA